MKNVLRAAALTFIVVSAQAADLDTYVTDGTFGFRVRGEGSYVCAAQDLAQQIPVLGRGKTRPIARMNALTNASSRAGHGDVTSGSAIIVCGQSRSETGEIFISTHAHGTHIGVEGQIFFQCVATSGMSGKPFTASASTLTEALALATSASSASEGDSGLFIHTACEQYKSVRPHVKVKRIRNRK